jgi:hypothetical protein
MDVRDAIQRIALEWPCYGRPRITRELRRRGFPGERQTGSQIRINLQAMIRVADIRGIAQWWRGHFLTLERCQRSGRKLAQARCETNVPGFRLCTFQLPGGAAILTSFRLLPDAVERDSPIRPTITDRSE